MLPGCMSHAPFRGQPGESPARPEGADGTERWALLSDPHISADLDHTARGVNLAGHLRAAVDGVLGKGPAPRGLILNGDCAFRSGEAGDYRALRQLLSEPMARAGVPLHYTLGNHDHRRHFLDSLPGDEGRWSAMESRWVTVVRGEYANFFLLDSLDPGNLVGGGHLGREQLHWLNVSLADADDKPALVFGHHPPSPNPLLVVPTGLGDADGLWQVLFAHPHVKAYVYGHTHCWDVGRRGDVHTVNLPATAYVFDARQPSGWINLWLGRDGAELTLWKIRGRTSARRRTNRVDPLGVKRPGRRRLTRIPSVRVSLDTRRSARPIGSFRRREFACGPPPARRQCGACARCSTTCRSRGTARRRSGRCWRSRSGASSFSSKWSGGCTGRTRSSAGSTSGW